MRNSVFLLLIFGLALFGCQKGPKMIKESDLKGIIYESVYADVLIENFYKLYSRDTIRFFEPILTKYGYNLDDFEYTIEKMVMRKSNVLPTLMTEISDEMKVVRAKYQYKKEVMDRWDERADSVTSKIILLDSAIVDSLSQIERLVYDFPIEQSGDFVVSMRYRIDSLDKNTSHIMLVQAFNAEKGLDDPEKYNRSLWLSKSKTSESRVVRHRASVDGGYFDTLRVEFVNIARFNKKPHTPYIKIDSMRVDFHYPKKVASAMLMDTIFGNNEKNKIGIKYEKAYSCTPPYIEWESDEESDN